VVLTNEQAVASQVAIPRRMTPGTALAGGPSSTLSAGGTRRPSPAKPAPGL